MAEENRVGSRVSAPGARPRLQAQHRDLTRALILRGLADVVAERGAHSFSVQEVADRAGVAHRTVYRHFPTREALLTALTEWLDEIQQRHRVSPVPEDLPDLIRRAFRLFDEQEPLIRALVITYTTTGIRPKGREERRRAFLRLVQTLAPDASAEDVRRASAVIHALASSQSWLYLRDQLGLSGEDAGEAVAWAVGVLMAELKRARSGTGGGDDDPGGERPTG